MTIGVGDMVAFPYQKPGSKKSRVIVAMLVKWNGNLNTQGLCVSTSYETYRRIVDTATHFSAWFGLYEVGAPNEQGDIVLTAEHAAVCRYSIEAYLMGKAGRELLATRTTKDDTVVPPQEGRGQLEVYDVPLAPFPGKGSFASPQMDVYLGRGQSYRRYLEQWQERQPQSYDMYLRSLHHRDPRCIGILDPSTIAA